MNLQPCLVAAHSSHNQEIFLASMVIPFVILAIIHLVSFLCRIVVLVLNTAILKNFNQQTVVPPGKHCFQKRKNVTSFCTCQKLQDKRNGPTWSARHFHRSKILVPRTKTASVKLWAIKLHTMDQPIKAVPFYCCARCYETYLGENMEVKISHTNLYLIKVVQTVFLRTCEFIKTVD